MNAAIAARRSIRKYRTDKPVTEEQAKQLLTAAMLAPSAKNSRPWEFIVLTNREILNEIAHFHPYGKMLLQAPMAIIVVAAPGPKVPEDYLPQDCGAATQNILLEAVDMGLGTCWCGIFPREDRVTRMAELLDIPAPKFPFCVIAVGVPDEAPAQRGFYEESKVSFVE